jgi:hypothetical protein
MKTLVTASTTLKSQYESMYVSGYVPNGDVTGTIATSTILNGAQSTRFDGTYSSYPGGPQGALWIADSNSLAVRVVVCPNNFPSTSATASVTFTPTASNTPTPMASLLYINSATTTTIGGIRIAGLTLNAIQANGGANLLHGIVAAVRATLISVMVGRPVPPNYIYSGRIVSGITLTLASVVDESTGSSLSVGTTDPVNMRQLRSISLARRLDAPTNTMTPSNPPTSTPMQPSMTSTQTPFAGGTTLDFIFNIAVTSGGNPGADGQFNADVIADVNNIMSSGDMFLAVSTQAYSLAGSIGLNPNLIGVEVGVIGNYNNNVSSGLTGGQVFGILLAVALGLGLVVYGFLWFKRAGGSFGSFSFKRSAKLTSARNLPGIQRARPSAIAAAKTTNSVQPVISMNPVRASSQRISARNMGV